MKLNSKILITGGTGMVGRNLKEQLENMGFEMLLCPSKEELNLIDAKETEDYIKKNNPDFVFHLAGLVYGLGGNLKHQLDSLYNNSLINLNLLNALRFVDVKKVFFAGTVASYPYPYKSLPLTEDQLFFGKPHFGEYGYAAAKNLGYQFLELLNKENRVDYCIGLFTNMFGEYDRFDEKNGHVIPSLISKLYFAKKNNESFKVWGNNKTSRDFLYVKDAVKAVIFLMDNFTGTINISSGQETSLEEIVNNLISAAEFKVEIEWDKNAPVGIEKRSVDNTKLKELGFNNFTDLNKALDISYKWYESNQIVK